MRNSMVAVLAILPALAQGQGARMDAGDSEPRIVVTAKMPMRRFRRKVS